MEKGYSKFPKGVLNSRQMMESDHHNYSEMNLHYHKPLMESCFIWGYHEDDSGMYRILVTDAVKFADVWDGRTASIFKVDE
jgi:hypothetical protein